jgi:hypothetical protein
MKRGLGRSSVALFGVFRLRLQKLLHFGVSQHLYRQDRTFVHTRTIGFADRLLHCRFLSRLDWPLALRALVTLFVAPDDRPAGSTHEAQTPACSASRQSARPSSRAATALVRSRSERLRPRSRSPTAASTDPRTRRYANRWAKYLYSMKSYLSMHHHALPSPHPPVSAMPLLAANSSGAA